MVLRSTISTTQKRAFLVTAQVFSSSISAGMASPPQQCLAGEHTTPQQVLNNLTFHIHIVPDSHTLVIDKHELELLVHSGRDNVYHGRGPSPSAPPSLMERRIRTGKQPHQALLSGLIAEVFHEIQNLCGFRYLIARVDPRGKYRNSVGSVGSSQGKNVMTVGGHWLTPHESDRRSVESGRHSVALRAGGARLIAKLEVRTLLGTAMSFLDPFSTGLWAGILGFTLLTAVLLWALESSEDSGEHVEERVDPLALEPQVEGQVDSGVKGDVGERDFFRLRSTSFTALACAVSKTSAQAVQSAQAALSRRKSKISLLKSIYATWLSLSQSAFIDIDQSFDPVQEVRGIGDSVWSTRRHRGNRSSSMIPSDATERYCSSRPPTGKVGTIPYDKTMYSTEDGNPEEGSASSSTRIVAACFSFFAMVFVAGYTANLAHFLMTVPTETVKGVHSGLKPGAVVCHHPDFTRANSYTRIVPSLERIFPHQKLKICDATAEDGGLGLFLRDDSPSLLNSDNPCADCSAFLSYEEPAVWSAQHDPSCRAYLGWQGEPLLPYANVFHFSPSTNLRVVEAFNAVITQMRLSGFLDRLEERHRLRVVSCPTPKTYLDLLDFSGIFAVMAIFYGVAVVLQCGKRGSWGQIFFSRGAGGGAQRKVGGEKLNAGSTAASIKVLDKEDGSDVLSPPRIHFEAFVRHARPVQDSRRDEKSEHGLTVISPVCQGVGS